jgi:Lrp/AsnC family transcriptional regulator for asnA, asnC and gidA
MKIKNEHTKMLAPLRENSRMPLTKLSRLTQIPVSTLFDQMKKHKECGLIRKFTSLLDFSKLGFNTRIYAAIKVNTEDREELGKFLEKSLNVNSLYRINNGYNFLVDCLFRDMGEVEDFKDELESRFQIKEMDVHFILEELRQESFMDCSSKAHVLTGGCAH